ncbi:MAG: N-acetyltransferase [Nitrosomonas sp. PRO4]|nr:N-acetyltransferase [Nitrosomonas sp. PRO4]
MSQLEELNSARMPTKPSAAEEWLSLVDEQFRKKDFKHARDVVLQGLKNFPNHPHLLDRLFIVDQRWDTPISGHKVHLTIPAEDDFPFLQQCYANDPFMEQLLPMGRKKQTPESIRFALQHREFSVAQSRTLHWIIKKEACADAPPCTSNTHLMPIGLASLIDIQIAHRRAELLVGIPGLQDRKKTSAISMLLILDFAFNRIGLHKLTSTVIASNQHSQKSTLAAGFCQEGLRRQHLRDPKSRTWLDCYENGLVEDHFRDSPVIARMSQRLLGRDITKSLSEAL